MCVCVCVCVFAGALNLSLYGSKSFNHICSVLTFTVETTLLKVLNVFSIYKMANKHPGLTQSSDDDQYSSDDEKSKILNQCPHCPKTFIQPQTLNRHID